jgi:outer membrane protein
MKDKSIITLLALFLLGMAPVFAQEKKFITLDEAVSMGIKNSKQLQATQARAREAESAVTEARQKMLPNASVSGSYMRLNSANVDLKTSGSSGSGSGSSSGRSMPAVSQALYGIVNLSLPIYSGGRIRYGIESSRFLADAEKLNVESDRDEVIQNLIEAYYNLYKAKSSINILTESLSQARQRARDFANLEKNGVLARNDLMKAELQASNIELTLLEAQNNWELANVNMNLMLGLPEKTILTVDSASVEQKPVVGALDDYLQSAQSGRKEIASLDLRKKAAETGVKSVKGEYLPSLSVTGGYIAVDIPKVFTVTNALNIGVGVSYNIASLWKTKAKVEQAEARVAQVAANEALVSDQVKLQVHQAYLNWISSEKKIQVREQAIGQAAETYRVVHNKYENSLATTTELLDANVALLQTQLSLAIEKADAIVVYHRLLRAAGQDGNSFK